MSSKQRLAQNNNPELKEDQITIKPAIKHIKQYKNRIKSINNNIDTYNSPTNKQKLKPNRQFQKNISLDENQLKIHFKNKSLSGSNVQQRKNHTQLYEEEYHSDFQSYKQTLKVQIQHQITKSQAKKYSYSPRNHIKKQEATKQTINCRQKIYRKNHVKSKSSVPTILPYINKKKSVSIEETQQQSQEFQQEVCRNCIDKFILMKQSSNYLQLRNQKIIEHLQFLRKIVPILKQNIQTLKSQAQEMRMLKKHQNRLLSVQYELKIDKEIAENQQIRHILQSKVRKSVMKYAKKDQNYNSNNANQSPQIKKLIQVRQRLLYAKRISNLYEQKQENIDNKVEMYSALNKKIESKLATNRMQFLQKNKLCLEFQIQKKRNQTKLLLIQKQLQIQMLQSQIYQTEGKIQFNLTNQSSNEQKLFITKAPTQQNVQKEELIQQEIQTYEEDFQIQEKIDLQIIQKNKMKSTDNINLEQKQQFSSFINKNNASKVKHEKLLKKFQASNVRIKINTLASNNFMQTQSQNLFQGQQF